MRRAMCRRISTTLTKFEFNALITTSALMMALSDIRSASSERCQGLHQGRTGPLVTRDMRDLYRRDSLDCQLDYLPNEVAGDLLHCPDGSRTGPSTARIMPPRVLDLPVGGPCLSAAADGYGVSDAFSCHSLSRTSLARTVSGCRHGASRQERPADRSCPGHT